MNFETIIQKHIQDHFPIYKNIVHTLYENPELGMEEYESSKLLCKVLEELAFKVERSYILPTAFKAVYHGCKKGLNIAFLCEYDALPEVGHGCAHNMIGAISIAAAASLKNVVDVLGGSIYVFGTPAEETHGGKVHLSNAHAFDEMDVAMMLHPGSDCTLSARTLALNPVRFEFFGKSAHACEPEYGKSALDAAVMTYTGISMLRQFVKRDTYIHGIIKEGGKAANVIPEYSCLDYYFRAPSRAYTYELEEKAEAIAKGACEATGCTYKKSIYECPYDDCRINYYLCNLLKEAFEKVEAKDIKPVDEIPSGSSDIGSVSYICPTIQGYIKICDEGINGHSKEFASATLSEMGEEGLYKGSLALAYLAACLLSDPAHMEKVKEEFGRSY